MTTMIMLFFAPPLLKSQETNFIDNHLEGWMFAEDIGCLRKEVIPELLLSIVSGFGRRIFQYKSSYSGTCWGLMITTMIMISIFEL